MNAIMMFHRFFIISSGGNKMFKVSLCHCESVKRGELFRCDVNHISRHQSVFKEVVGRSFKENATKVIQLSTKIGFSKLFLSPLAQAKVALSSNFVDTQIANEMFSKQK